MSKIKHTRCKHMPGAPGSIRLGLALAELVMGGGVMTVVVVPIWRDISATGAML